MKAFFIPCFSLVLGSLFAQPKMDLEQIKLKFPNSLAVVFNNEVLKLDVVDDKLVASRDYLIQYVVLDEKAIGLAEKSVTYIPGFFELSAFEATTYVPNGKSYKKLKVNQWEDKNRISHMFFYDDVKYRQFVFPGVQKGSILELKYTYNQLDPTMQFPFHFQENVPVIKGSFTIQYSDKVKPYVKFFGDSVHIEHTQFVNGRTNSLSWSIQNFPEWKGFSHAPSHPYNLPHAFPFIKEYKTETKGWQAGLNSTSQLYAHNMHFVKDLNKDTAIPELQKLIDSLTSTSNSPESLTRSIYYWVQENIKYIAFEDGLGGFVPRQANDIFRKRYGDCKDMSSLITYMCRLGGMPSYLCWIGTRDLPYTYSDLPLPNADNHMIAAVYTSGKWQFLDATARFLRFGFPSGFIQGKEALVAISSDSFQVVKVPVMPAKSNTRYDSTSLSWVNGHLEGDIHLKLDGYPKFDLVENLKLTKSHKIAEAMEHSLIRGSNKCKINTVTYKELEDRDKPLHVSAKIELPDYAKQIDNQLYVNFYLDKSFSHLKIDTAGRTVGREFEFAYQDTRVVSMELPKGYKALKLPNELVYNGAKLAYTLRCSQVGNRVISRFESQVKVLMLEKEDFAEWNKQMDKLTQAFREVVVLEKAN
jgi:hypothetical protein